MNQNAKEHLLSLAPEKDRERFGERRSRAAGVKEGGAWTGWQREFLRAVDEYLAVETAKPHDINIHMHEAGGQFRVAFPHMQTRGTKDVIAYMNAHMAARRAYAVNNLFHGYVDSHEVHHEPETFLYFQIPLLYWGYGSKELAAVSIEDVAEHCGNWSPEVIPWYDWERHGFVSTWLGTKAVRDFPPFDYQEANHFRFIDIALAAYKATAKERYLQLATDYADRWCGHIERNAGANYIPCSILPEGAVSKELGFAGKTETAAGYLTFYTTVAMNTTFDIAVGLFNTYVLSGNRRYLDCAKAMIDQHAANGHGGRPSPAYSADGWQRYEDRQKPAEEITADNYPGAAASVAKLMMMYDRITNTETYRDAILNWASVIDENRFFGDVTAVGLLSYAHYYDGNPQWLARAYELFLRTAALAEYNDEFHQCNSRSRQGHMAGGEELYLPITGCLDFSVRGSLPLPLVRHMTGGVNKLPDGVSFRLWKNGASHSFEAVNHTEKAVSWTVEAGDKKLAVELAPLGTASGVIGV